MGSTLGSLHARVTRAVVTGDLTLYQANQIHALLSMKPTIATATELIDLKAALIAVCADTNPRLFAAIPL